MQQQRPSRRALVAVPSLCLALAVSLFAASPAAARESAGWWPTWDRLIGWLLPLGWGVTEAPEATPERVLITIDPNGLDLEAPTLEQFLATNNPDHSQDASN